MTLEGFKTGSFAGLADLELAFGPSLTIVSGPNEAGKSTIFSALTHTLFTPSGVNKRRFESELARFLPLSGGDTIDGTLFFEDRGQYVLRRSWGARSEDVLTLPDGGTLKDPRAVLEALRGLLPAGEGTMKNIFLVRQNGLKRTLEGLRESPETGDELGTVIRKSLFETGGLSVDRFTRLLEKRYAEYAGRWDFHRGEPEGGRGPGNPWKSGAGTIVRTWYTWRSLEDQRLRVERAETERAGLVKDFSALGEELEVLKEYLSRNRRLFEDMKGRAEKEMRRENALRTREKHQEAMDAWTRLETETARDRKEIERLEEAVRRFGEEKEAALRAGRDRELKKHAGGIQALREAVERITGELASSPEITGETVAELRAAARAAEGMRNRLSSAELGLVFRGKEKADILVSTGTGEKVRIAFSPGSEETLQAGGYAEIDTPYYTLTVAPAGLDVAAAREELEGRTARLEELLAGCGVSTLEEAEAAALARAGLEQKLRQARGAYEEALDGGDYEKIITAAAAAEEHRTRPTELVAADEASAAAERRAALEGLERRREELETLRRSYGDREGLNRVFAEAAVKAEECIRALEGCGEVPEGFDRPEEFLADYSRKEERRRGFEEKWYLFRQRMLEVEQSFGDQSEEELAADCQEAREEFLRAERAGRCLGDLRGRTEEILKTLDRDTFQVFGGSCAAYLDKLTAGSYKEVDLDGGIPAGVYGRGGKLPFSLLSSGTADVFALAVRLAAADVFLKGSRGFLVMDDPMVDMDPRRRERAASVIEGWSERNQVILFTCHPEHTALFTNPRLIDLER